MASTYAKRLAKLEELMAAKLNVPLAHIWLEAGETREEAIERAGYDLSQADRITTIRWRDERETGIAPPSFSWDDPEPGPPADSQQQTDQVEDDAGQTVRGDVQRSEAGETPAACTPDFETEERYKAAVEQRAREIVAEKLAEATAKFSKSIA
jgi:hypothetical protein